jgi:hypothetical protein
VSADPVFLGCDPARNLCCDHYSAETCGGAGTGAVAAGPARSIGGADCVLPGSAADGSVDGVNLSARSGAGRPLGIAAYDAKHQLARADDRVTLIIGNEEWPFPIPLVRQDDAWRFDTAAVRDEIRFRRIGHNELSVIQAVLAHVDAQREYAAQGHSTGAAGYARRIASRPGQKDGLHWQTKQGEEPSPLGALVARAAEGSSGARRAPYHGYYFKILTRQGPNAPGGALDYVARGKMIGGFALLAYPVSYGNSGVMTFLVNHRGVVFEKDLGSGTARLAAGMTAFDPDGSWKKVANNGKPWAGTR